MPDYDPPLKRVLDQFGPTALGRKLGIQPSAIPQWKRVPVHHVARIAQLTGISPHELRPDVYAPEQAPTAPAVA